MAYRSTLDTVPEMPIAVRNRAIFSCTKKCAEMSNGCFTTDTFRNKKIKLILHINLFLHQVVLFYCSEELSFGQHRSFLYISLLSLPSASKEQIG